MGWLWGSILYVLVHFKGQECVTPLKGNSSPKWKREGDKIKSEGVGQLLMDGNKKLKSSFKRSDRTGMSAAEVMTETATGLWQRLKTESIWAEKEAERCCVLETDANWKKLRRSSTSYENAKSDCLTTKAGSKKRRNPTFRTLLQQRNSSGDGVNHELGCNLRMLYLIWNTFVHIGFHLT